MFWIVSFSNLIFISYLGILYNVFDYIHLLQHPQKNLPSLLCWSGFVNFTHNRLIWEEGTLAEELPLSD